MEERKEIPAIEGGKPVRKSKIFYGRQWVNEEDVQAVSQVLLSDYLTCGPKITELEQKVSAITGAKYVAACTNGTSALHLAVAAAGIGAYCGGSSTDEIIVTPLTFMASANCALYCGAVPVFADIDEKTYEIDPEDVERKITPNTKAIVAVDFTGAPCRWEALRRIADKHHLVLIEDAAHSIGTRYKGVPVGSIADLTCFSFHPVKTVTGGEGGAVATNDKKWAKRLCLLRSHAMEHDHSLFVRADEIPDGDDGPWYYEQQALGYNYRMTDMQAALLCSQLGRIDTFIARRKAICQKYNEVFKKLDGVILQEEYEGADTSRHLYILRLDLTKLTCTRRQFFDAMSAENVQCQVHYIPVYWMPVYREKGYAHGLCPKAEAVYGSIMSIPLYPKMKDEDAESVIAAVKKLVTYYHK